MKVDREARSTTRSAESNDSRENLHRPDTDVDGKASDRSTGSSEHRLASGATAGSATAGSATGEVGDDAVLADGTLENGLFAEGPVEDGLAEHDLAAQALVEHAATGPATQLTEAAPGPDAAVVDRAVVEGAVGEGAVVEVAPSSAGTSMEEPGAAEAAVTTQATATGAAEPPAETGGETVDPTRRGQSVPVGSENTPAGLATASDATTSLERQSAAMAGSVLGSTDSASPEARSADAAALQPAALDEIQRPIEGEHLVDAEPMAAASSSESGSVIGTTAAGPGDGGGDAMASTAMASGAISADPALDPALTITTRAGDLAIATPVGSAALAPEPVIAAAVANATASALDAEQESQLWNQVQQALARVRAGEEGQELRMRLRPADLGELLVQVQRRGEQLTVRLSATSDAAQQALAEGQSRLSEELADAGFGGASVDVRQENDGRGAREEGDTPRVHSSLRDVDPIGRRPLRAEVSLGRRRDASIEVAL